MVKVFSFLAAFALLGAAVADFLLLRGEKVYSGHGELVENTDARVPVDEAGVPHRLIINTGSSHRRDYEIALNWSLAAPDGSVIDESNEMAAYSNRNVEFLPEQTGAYVLTMSPNYTTADLQNRLQTEDRYSLSLLINDKSIVIPFLQSLPF